MREWFVFVQTCDCNGKSTIRIDIVGRRSSSALSFYWPLAAQDLTWEGIRCISASHRGVFFLPRLSTKSWAVRGLFSNGNRRQRSVERRSPRQSQISRGSARDYDALDIKLVKHFAKLALVRISIIIYRLVISLTFGIDALILRIQSHGL
ncbi:hypothetical protein EI94DRAFT_1722807 [Lactarius quietus]|nr:hypothetical protein EI94DRAFT_1722807 [Lactarius quietus]